MRKNICSDINSLLYFLFFTMTTTTDINEVSLLVVFVLLMTALLGAFINEYLFHQDTWYYLTEDVRNKAKIDELQFQLKDCKKAVYEYISDNNDYSLSDCKIDLMICNSTK